MRLTSFVTFLFLTALMSVGQNQSQGDAKKINQFIVPVDLLDPAYPVLKNTGDAVRDAQNLSNEVRVYTKYLEKLPQYEYTGDVAKDQATYEESIRLFLEEHPYFPQPIVTNNEQRDAEVFECLWKGYFKFYPEQAKRIVNVDERGGVK